MISITKTKEHPIIFTTELIPKILDGTKTQTRRVIKPQPKYLSGENYSQWYWCKKDIPEIEARRIGINHAVWWEEVKDPFLMMPFCPYGQVGDRLWVREKLKRKRNYPNMPDYITYASTLTGVANSNPEESYTTPLGTKPFRPTWIWKGDIVTAMFMPRWASRITLEITALRFERVQEINSWDAKREGCPFKIDHNDPAKELYDEEMSIEWFKNCWNSFNAKRGYPWESNPWVWVIGFELIPQNSYSVDKEERE